MAQSKTEALMTKLEKGRQKTLEVFRALTPEQWRMTIYTEPHWQALQLLVHFVSAENQLLRLAQSTVGSGRGAPLGFDVDQYNAAEQKRLEGKSAQDLLVALEQSRQQTIEWAQTLTPDELDKLGYHPALGEVTVETMLAAIHGHHLMHLRDLSRILKAEATG